MSLLAEPAGHWNTLFDSFELILIYLFVAAVGLALLGCLLPAIIGLARGGMLGKRTESEWRRDPERRTR
jgi:hypothetical protein